MCLVQRCSSSYPLLPATPPRPLTLYSSSSICASPSGKSSREICPSSSSFASHLWRLGTRFKRPRTGEEQGVQNKHARCMSTCLSVYLRKRVTFMCKRTGDQSSILHRKRDAGEENNHSAQLLADAIANITHAHHTCCTEKQTPQRRLC